MNPSGGPSHPRPSEGAPGWIVAALVLVAALAIVVWKAFAPGDPETGGVDLALPMLSTSIASAPSSEPAASDPEPSTAGPSGTEMVEVCGLGWVPVDASGTWDMRTVRAVPDVVASQRAVLDAIRRDDGEFGAAIATSLELHGAARDGDAGDPARALRCKDPACGASAEDKQFAAGLLEQLAKQGTATQDARIYAIALRECASAPEQGSCALLNVDQWARLDPDNALPWLHILKRARQRGDEAQTAEALYRIGTAARFEEGLFAAAGRIADNAGAGDVDAIAAQLLALDAVLQAGARQAPFIDLSAVCRAPATADANRRQACDAAAATLAERSDSALALVTGASLGRRLGWTDDRVDALRGLVLARSAMDNDSAPASAAVSSGDVPSTCSGARRMLATFSRQGQLGELQPVRDWLGQEGRSIAGYAGEAHELYRQREQATAVAVAADAASAAASNAPALAPSSASPYSASQPPSR